MQEFLEMMVARAGQEEELDMEQIFKVRRKLVFTTIIWIKLHQTIL